MVLELDPNDRLTCFIVAAACVVAEDWATPGGRKGGCLGLESLLEGWDLGGRTRLIHGRCMAADGLGNLIQTTAGACLRLWMTRIMWREMIDKQG